MALCFIICCKSNNRITRIDNYVFIPADEYLVGKTGHRVNPERKVRVREFAISRYEITNTEFDSFVKSTGYKTLAERYKNAQVFGEDIGEYEWERDSTAYWRFPNGIKRGGIERKMNHPVTCICYFDMEAYCKWKKVRLPSLDEWEIASRAGSNALYFFGNDMANLDEYANVWHAKNHRKEDKSDGYVFTSPVGKFKPNPWGLYDIYGNVFEMCNTMAKAYGKDNQYSSARGGSWWCSRYSCSYFNSVDIGRINKVATFSNMGFRVVKLNK